MSYKATVCCLTNLRSHPNADRIQLATVANNQVVVGLDAEIGQLGVFFPSDGQLSMEFATANDLIRRRDPETGVITGGFFEKNRRVRVQKFRGEKSEGFWCPIQYFIFTGDISALVKGYEFDTLNGIPICNKYLTQATRQMSGQRQLRHRSETTMFRMHVETEQFRMYADQLPFGALVTITEKLHGTSERVGLVLDDMPVKFTGIKHTINRILHFPLFLTRQRAWRRLVGTRHVILEHHTGNTFYDDENFRYQAIENILNLHKGEVIYCEIVGWTAPNTPIMAAQDTTKLKDKTLLRQYGPQMLYAYNCLPGTAKAYVYRIIMINEDGIAVELPWARVKTRCRELNIAYVPELKSSFVLVNREALCEIVDKLQDVPSILDSNHLREGVVVRVDHDGGTDFYKHKGFYFGVLEGYLKEDPNFVDAEEIA